jgi:hypothetical protein
MGIEKEEKLQTKGIGNVFNKMTANKLCERDVHSYTGDL